MSKQYTNSEILCSDYNRLCCSCYYIDLNKTKDSDSSYYDPYHDTCNKYYCSKKWDYRYLDTNCDEARCRYYEPNGRIDGSYIDFSIVDDMIRFGGPYNRRKESGSYSSSNGCYITTIVTKLLGLGDDNELLNTLRVLRKDILQTNPKYKNILMEYDVIGPKIAEYIETDKELYDINVLEKYIKYCASLVKQNKFDEAVAIYTNMVNMLKEIFNIENEIVNVEGYDYTVGGHGYVKSR